MSVSFADRIGPRLSVQFDGVEQQYVHTYDTEHGYLDRFVTTRTGLKTTPDGKEVQRERLFGSVTVTWRAD